MLSDTFGRNLAFGLLVFMLSYYQFIRFTINMRGEYNNRKCSPLNMFIGGLVGSGTDDVFEQCASNVTEDNINAEFKNYAESRQRNMDANYNNINNKTSDISNKVAEDASKYLEDAQNTAATASQMKEDQRRMTKAIEESSGILSDSLATVRRIVQNFSDAAHAFVQSPPVQKL